MISLRDDDQLILPELILSPANGFRVSSFEPGFPEVRDDAEERVQGQGTREYTLYYGAAAVSLEALIYPPAGISRQSLVDRLAQYCHPQVRAYIHWSLNDDAGVSRCMMIRGSRLSRPITNFNRRSVQCQWVAPKGVSESSIKKTTTVPLSNSTTGTSTTGRSYPLLYKRTYGVQSQPTGTTEVTNAGNEIAYPIIRIWGGITDPEVINITYGIRMKFVLTVPQGSYLDIDTLNQTVLMNGSAYDSRYGTMDVGVSDWWGLVPGINQIGLIAASSQGTNIRAEFIYRDAWI